MAWIHVTHTVEDYEAWKAAFDAFATDKREYGWKQSMVFHKEGEPNTLVVMEEFETRRQAHAFLESKKLRDAMKKAGVSSPPEMQVLELTAKERAPVAG